MVKDAIQVFDEGLEKIIKLIDSKNYTSCQNLATELITVSFHSEFDDGVFIGETLEGIFDQIDDLTMMFEIDENYQNDIKEQLNKQLTLLVKSYKDKDKNKTFEALRQLRSIATRYQLSSPNKFSRRAEFKRGRVVTRGMY